MCDTKSQSNQGAAEQEQSCTCTCQCGPEKKAGRGQAAVISTCCGPKVSSGESDTTPGDCCGPASFTVHFHMPKGQHRSCCGPSLTETGTSQG